MRRNLAKTKRPARLVLLTKIINVCVLSDLRAIIVKTVGDIDLHNLVGFSVVVDDAAVLLLLMKLSLSN